MNDLDEQLTAYHESGHALVAHLLGAQVKQLSTETAGEDGPDRYGSAEIHWRRSSMTNRQLSAAVVQVCLAGPIAEMIYTGEPYHPGFVTEWTQDWQMAWEAASQLEIDERKRLALLEQITVDLYKQLDDELLWSKIAALADNLLAFETLEAAQIRDIIANG